MSALYAPVDSKIIDKLSFPYSACNYVYYSNKHGAQNGTLYSTDETTFYKLKGIFEGDRSVQVNKGDKVFVLPGSPLSHSRLKEYFKNVEANSTKTISAATIVAGCKGLYEEVQKSSDQAKREALLIEAVEIYEVNNNDTDAGLQNTFNKFSKDPKEVEDLLFDFNSGTPTICSNRFQKSIGFNQNVDMVKDRYFITPDGMAAIYYILSKGLKVMTEDTVSSKANSGIKLEDEETYRSISQMMESVDEQNRNLAIDLLVHCDITGETLFKLWTLSKKFGNKVARSNSSKGLDYFLRASKWSYLRSMSSRELLMYAETEGMLTKDLVSRVTPLIYKSVKADSVIPEPYEDGELSTDPFFDFIDHGDMSYTIQLKEKWKLILKEEEDE